MTRINQNSNYWAGNLTGSLDMWWREDLETKKGRDVVALAGYRRAIANFVNIVTSRTDIPVTYNSADESFTDGKKVYLSGNMNEKNFDPNVGLALHEGSHIKLSNFALLRNLDSSIPEELYRLGERKGRDRNQVFADVRNVLNYIEDRRVDSLVFKSSPGYKGYYHTLYSKYFNHRNITKGATCRICKAQNTESSSDEELCKNEIEPYFNNMLFRETKEEEGNINTV